MSWTPDGSEIKQGLDKLTRFRSVNPDQGLNLRGGPEFYGHYYIDGKKTFHISAKAHPNRSISRYRRDTIAESMGISIEQLRELCQCRISGPNFHVIAIQNREAGVYD